MNFIGTLMVALTLSSTCIFAQSNQIGFDSSLYIKDASDLSKLLPILQEGQKFTEKMQSELDIAWSDLYELLFLGFCDEENIIKLKNFIADFNTKIIDYEEKYTKEASNLKTKLNNAFANEKMKQAFFIGYEKTNKPSEKIMKDFFRVEKDILRNINNLLKFLSFKMGEFSEIDQLLNFDEQKDADTYDQLIEKIIAGEQEKEAILEQADALYQSIDPAYFEVFKLTENQK